MTRTRCDKVCVMTCYAGCRGLCDWRLMLRFLTVRGHWHWKGLLPPLSGGRRARLRVGWVRDRDGGGGQMTTAPASDLLSGREVQSSQRLVLGSKYSTLSIVTCTKQRDAISFFTV